MVKARGFTLIELLVVIAINAFDKNYKENGIATDMITCPTCNGDFYKDFVRLVNWPNHDFAEFAYSYFGRADLLNNEECGLSAKRDLAMVMSNGEKSSLRRTFLLWKTGTLINGAVKAPGG
jgi:hypothetical protein